MKTDFDPTKHAKFNMTGESLPGLKGEDVDKYDPTKVINEIDQIKKQRASELEGIIQDKDVKVINSNTGTGQNLKQLLFELDQKEQ